MVYNVEFALVSYLIANLPSKITLLKELFGYHLTHSKGYNGVPIFHNNISLKVNEIT